MRRVPNAEPAPEPEPGSIFIVRQSPSQRLAGRIKHGELAIIVLNSERLHRRFIYKEHTSTHVHETDLRVARKSRY